MSRYLITRGGDIIAFIWAIIAIRDHTYTDLWLRDIAVAVACIAFSRSVAHHGRYTKPHDTPDPLNQ